MWRWWRKLVGLFLAKPAIQTVSAPEAEASSVVDTVWVHSRWVDPL